MAAIGAMFLKNLCNKASSLDLGITARIADVIHQGGKCKVGRVVGHVAGTKKAALAGGPIVSTILSAAA